MNEVTVTIRFIRECLGAERRHLEGEGDVFCMHRAGESVIFLPSWWKAITRYAAQVLNQPQSLIDRIDWDPVIVGMPRRWRRYFPTEPTKASERRRYAKHEAFRAGDVIYVNCVLPDGLSPADFRSVLETAGKYKGISPYRPGQFGNFQVEDVRERRYDEPPCRELLDVQD